MLVWRPGFGESVASPVCVMNDLSKGLWSIYVIGNTSIQNDGLLGYVQWLWAMVLHLEIPKDVIHDPDLMANVILHGYKYKILRLY